jgi:hypothetical protein
LVAICLLDPRRCTSAVFFSIFQGNVDASAADNFWWHRDDGDGRLHPRARSARSTRPGGRSGDLLGQLVQRARRARKVRKDPSVHKAPSASAGLLVLPDRQDQSDRRARRARLADKALLDPVASAVRPERRDPLVQQGRRAQQVRRVIPARRQQFALSPAWTPFAVRTTRCWPVWFVRWARPTERNAQRPARRQPACVYVGNVKPNLVALLLAAAAITISKERTVPTPFASFSRSQPSRR